MAGESYGALPGLEPPRRRAPGAPEAIAPYVAEFVGTFMLVFTMGACGIAGDAAWSPTAVACTFAAMAYAFGPVSGGHLNPAISVACGLARAAPWPRVAGYALAQVAAGLVAGWACFEVFGQAAPVGPKSSYGWFQVGLVEMVYTAVLGFVVLNCTASARNNPWEDQNSFFALAVGFVLIAGGYAAGSVSGGCFNPAAALGLDVLGAAGREAGGWWRVAYVAYQLLGSAIAALLFSVCRGKEAPASGPAPLRAAAGALQLRVLAAHNLRNRDSGFGGDVSDPYVTVRVGLTEYRTPTISNNLNPTWLSDNVFIFNLVDGGGRLALEVLNENVVLKDQSLGTLAVDLRELPVGAWQRRKERLLDGRGGELEFDLLLESSSSSSTTAGAIVEPTLSRKLCCEFVGTFVLVLTVGLSLAARSPAAPGAGAAALLCMTYSLAGVSGGHFNPAVTLAVVLSRRGKCPPGDGLACAAAQLLAGTLAGLMVAGFHVAGPYKDEPFGLPEPGSGGASSWKACFAAELAFTFMLAFTVLSVATAAAPPADTTQNFRLGLAVGACFAAGGLAVGAVSGGELNPALAFGVATAGIAGRGGPPWAGCLWFSAFELAGGVLAAAVFSATHAAEFAKPASLQF